MSADVEVSIFIGPSSWFHQQLGDAGSSQSLIELTYARDELSRQLKVNFPGDEDADTESPPRPDLVFAESGDFASLNEHVISNFIGLVRAINPRRLVLQNPPAQVQAQLERAIPSTRVQRFEYPSIDLQTLRDIRDGFDDRLIGQSKVKERLLAALYPLTRAGRDAPVVLMFYGPSGVGKTESAQFVNGLLGGTLFRKQFSMFHSEKFASYLFGGSHSEASLGRDLLDRESGVILIDEFDKANPVFHSAFYQLFDGGEFEDKNYKVHIGPSLVICTSNYGSDREVRDSLGEALYSRFDAVIQFENLERPELLQVLEALVDDSLSRLDEDEQSHVDREDLLRMLAPRISQTSNVRSLGKTVNELVALIVLRAMLGDMPPGAEAPGAE